MDDAATLLPKQGNSLFGHQASKEEDKKDDGDIEDSEEEADEDDDLDEDREDFEDPTEGELQSTRQNFHFDYNGVHLRGSRTNCKGHWSKDEVGTRPQIDGFNTYESSAHNIHILRDQRINNYS